LQEPADTFPFRKSSLARAKAGNVEQILAKLGLERKVAMSASYALAAQGAVRLLPLPFEGRRFKVSRFWCASIKTKATRIVAARFAEAIVSRHKINTAQVTSMNVSASACL
jgi:hypothetical protein